MPVDVSEETLRAAALQLAERYPDLQVEALVGDFTLHLGHLPGDGRRMVAFLGGTIGNLYVEERAAFLGALADSLEPGDWLLLGTDLVKSADRLIAAYDDPGGVTARFVTNCLQVLNDRLDADFDLDAFTYVPFWDPRMERMDLRLRAEMPQHVVDPGRRHLDRPGERRGDPGRDLDEVPARGHRGRAGRGRLRRRAEPDRRRGGLRAHPRQAHGLTPDQVLARRLAEPEHEHGHVVAGSLRGELHDEPP